MDMMYVCGSSSTVVACYSGPGPEDLRERNMAGAAKESSRDSSNNYEETAAGAHDEFSSFYDGDQRRTTLLSSSRAFSESSGENIQTRETEVPYADGFEVNSPASMAAGHGKDEMYFPKWRLPSKIRRKFIAHEEDSESKTPDHVNNTNTDTNTGGVHSPRNNALRVCVDCNTTKTPLWRSGPQGPKSLCNACGIRYRKKRRALFASMVSDAAESVRPKKRNNSLDAKSAVKKQKRSGHPLQHKFLALCQDVYGNFHKGPSSATIQRRFAREEEEAARLLMAISYGLVLA
uniref:TSA: Wollemia nobilis Ref_Wollemi_Transcript_7469_1487 transcribed RNA sequence n=1 Tax=Wollemia nobilis TaxID=56998 RepID=A0A0C9QV69_9CONI